MAEGAIELDDPLRLARQCLPCSDDYFQHDRDPLDPHHLLGRISLQVRQVRRIGYHLLLGASVP